MAKRIFTSESVTEGHPDKVCDQIADAILDDIITKDPGARVALEITAARGLVVILGEMTANAYSDIVTIAREKIKEIGYKDSKFIFDGDSCAIINGIDNQSPDIAMGVDDAYESRGSGAFEIGAGDQGMMFGFACDETDTYMPMPIYLAHKLTKQLSIARKTDVIPYLGPDGKAQVTVEYDGDKPVRVDTIVVSSQHLDGIEHDQIEADIKKHVINEVIPKDMMDDQTKIFINPTGRFVLGGPQADTGVTGRKIIVDTYGGYARHGGGAFSGKDPTKVDRSASYAARYIAKNLVAAGIANKCEIQVAYAIGVAKPVSIRVDTFGTGKYAEEDIEKVVGQLFDLRPHAIIDMLDLKKPIYSKTDIYGHFGWNDDIYRWERLDKVDEIKEAFNNL